MGNEGDRPVMDGNRIVGLSRESCRALITCICHQLQFLHRSTERVMWGIRESKQKDQRKIRLRTKLQLLRQSEKKTVTLQTFNISGCFPGKCVGVFTLFMSTNSDATRSAFSVSFMGCQDSLLLIIFIYYDHKVKSCTLTHCGC